jgi:hypothetical protein
LRTLTLVLVATLLTSGLLSAAVSKADAPDVWRFGVAFTRSVWEGERRVPQSLGDYDLAPLRIGWYSDWSYNATPEQSRDQAPLEYVQLILVRDSAWPPAWDRIQAAVQANRGALWLIGNEPECPNQGNLTPQVYAERFHQARTAIRGWDSTARIGIGGVVEPTPLRLRWLDATLSAYQAQFGRSMTDNIDVWNIHMQILTEGPGNSGAGEPVGITFEPGEPRQYTLADCANVDLFKTLVRAFRTWLADKGERDKPLIISEMGVLMPSYLLIEDGSLSEPERIELGNRRIEQFMGHVFDWLLEARSASTGCTVDGNLLVQRWLWFSLNDSFYDEATQHGFNGALYDYASGRLTRFGHRMVAYRSQTKRVFLSLIER